MVVGGAEEGSRHVTSPRVRSVRILRKFYTGIIREGGVTVEVVRPNLDMGVQIKDFYNKIDDRDRSPKDWK